jgi:ornithine cyclodeaminase
MPNVTILTADDLKSCVELDAETVAVVENAFRALAEGSVVMPPALSMAIAERHGGVEVGTAYMPGLDAFAVKVSPGFFDNPRRGLPSLDGLTILLDSETGIVRSVLLDNGYLTGIRTAAAGAVAAKHLAPAEFRTAGVIGAGVQAELQIRALKLVRDFSELLVWTRGSGKAEAYALKMRNALNISVRVAATVEDVVQHADVLVTTTPAQKPLIRRDWLHPGLHITAVGSDAPDKNELDPRILVEADRFVTDRNEQSRRLGEMRTAIATGLLAEDHIADELGEIVAGMKPGRQGDEEITVCDLTGTSAQDTAIAAHAYRIAVECGLGLEIED